MVLAVGLAPLAEELMFRGVLFGRLARATSIWAAILYSAAIFALMHAPAHGAMVLLVFGVGVAFGWVRAARGRLRDSVLAHAAYNLTVTGVAFLQ